MTRPPTAVRELGFVEAGFHVLNSRVAATAQGLAAVLVDGDLQAHRLERALATLWRNWPALRAVVVEHNQRAHFELLNEDQPLPLTLERHEAPARWQDTFEEELAVPLDPCGVPWRVRALLHARGPLEHVLLVSVCHVVFDATAIAEFVRAILLHASTDQDCPPAAFPSSAEQAMPNVVSRTAYSALRRWETDQAQSVARMPHAVSVPIEQRRTRTIFASYDQFACTRLRERLQTLGLSTYSAASAAAMRSVCSTTPNKPDAIANTAFSLRSLLKKRPLNESLGCFLAVMGTTHEGVLGHMDAWSLAAEHQRLFLKATLKLCALPESFDLPALVDQIPRVAQLDRFIQDLAVICVRPELDLPRGALRVVEYFVAARRHAGNISAGFHVFELPERVCVCLNYVEPLSPRAWAEACFERFIAELGIEARQSSNARMSGAWRPGEEIGI